MKRGMERAIEIVENMRDFARAEANKAKACGAQVLFEVWDAQSTSYDAVLRTLKDERPKRMAR